MAHYAFIDENNVVVETICGQDEDDLPHGISSWEEYYSEVRGLRCLRYSINTMRNTHTAGKEPFRYNAAHIGGTYNEQYDAFVPPKPELHPSFVIDENEFVWIPPIPYPDDGLPYDWDEEQICWVPEKAGPTEPPPKKGEWIWHHQQQAWLPA